MTTAAAPTRSTRRSSSGAAARAEHAVRRGDREPRARRAGARREDEVEGDLRARWGTTLGRKVARNFDDYRALGERDRRNIERLDGEIGGRALVLVPYLDDDVHDVGGLMRMNEHLFAAGAVPA